MGKGRENGECKWSGEREEGTFGRKGNLESNNKTGIRLLNLFPDRQ